MAQEKSFEENNLRENHKDVNNIQLNFSDNKHTKLSNYSLNELRKAVRKALGYLNSSEESIFYAIPEEHWKMIFDVNFNNDLTFAQKYILNKEDLRDYHRSSKQINEFMTYIDNFYLSNEIIENAFKNKTPILLITDTDNDGSFSQTIAYYLRNSLTPEENSLLHIEYARAVENNKTRGFTCDLIIELTKIHQIKANQEFLIITADNGINSYEEQLKINSIFPKATLLITDHHNPETNLVIQENEQTYVFNPHYSILKDCMDKDFAQQRYENNKLLNSSYTKSKHDKSKEFFQKYNISGASTFGLLATNLIKNRLPNLEQLSLDEQFKNQEVIQKHNNTLKDIEKLSYISNMLDYVHTHSSHKPLRENDIKEALNLQGLMNVVNSMNPFILNTLDENILNKLKIKAQQRSENEDPFNLNMIKEMNMHTHSLNVVAHLLLSDYIVYKKLNEQEKIIVSELTIDNPSKRIADLSQGLIKNEEFTYYTGNNNYIEQLRPIIFYLMVQEDKNVFEQEFYEQMISVFTQLSKIERNVMQELRKIDITNVYEEENVCISVVDKDFQRVFNRKLLGKTYNRANNGFLMILDNTQENIMSGSFRSTYDISVILPKTVKKTLERKIGVTIDTVGHERAAGFIIKSKKESFTSEKQEEIIQTISEFINNRLDGIKNNPRYRENYNMTIISDMDSLELISKLNNIIRGSVSHFYRLTPLIKLNPLYTIAVNNRNGEQQSLTMIAEKDKYGWTPLTLKLGGRSHEPIKFLIPNTVLTTLNKTKFNDLVRLNYMNDGTFVFDSIVNHKEIQENKYSNVYLEKNSLGEEELIKFYKKQAQTGKNIEYLTNQDLKKLPFFQYNSQSEHDFKLYESYIINRLYLSGKHISSTVDVEATGFGNASLFNIGAMNYIIDENSGKTLSQQEFNHLLIEFPFQDMKLPYLMKNEQVLQELINNKELKLIQPESFSLVGSNNIVKIQDKYYQINDNKVYNQNIFDENPNFEMVYSYKIDNNKVIYNQEIIGENISFIIKPDHFVIPPAFESLTNISNQVALQYGKTLNEVDELFYDYYQKFIKEGKDILFEAHNTNYDARIIRTNMPKLSQLFINGENLINDSALLAKQHHLMYFDTDSITFKGVKGLENIYFNFSPNSTWGLKQMLLFDGECEVQDIKHEFTLSKVPNQNKYDYYLYNHKNHSTIKLNMQVDTKELSELEKQNLAKDLDRLNLNKDNQINELPEIINFDLNDLIANIGHDIFNKVRVSKEVSKGRKKSDFVYQELSWIPNNVNSHLNAFYADLPQNRVGYNAHGIAETLAITNFANWIVEQKQLKVHYLDLNNYPEIKEDENMLKYANNFMSSYKFEHSCSSNLNKIKFIINYDTKQIVKDDENLDMKSLDNELQSMYQKRKILEKFCNDFIQLNHELARIYDNRWLYLNILHHFEPKHINDLNQDNFQRVAHQASVPIELATEVLQYAYSFQQEFKSLGCKAILPIEQHNNGVSKGNFAGDTAFEAPAVGLMAVRKLGSPLVAANLSIEYGNKFTLDLLESIKKSYLSAVDSMSFKQHRVFLKSNQNKTELIEELSNKEYDMFNKDNQIIIFKLRENVLDTGNCIYAVKKNGVILDSEMIDKDSEMLEFIFKIKQIATQKEQATSYYPLLESNLKKLNEFKQKLQEHYCYIEFNESIKYTNDYCKKINETLTDNIDYDSDKIETRYKSLLNHQILKFPTKNSSNNPLEMVSEQHFIEVNKTIKYFLILNLKHYLNGLNDENYQFVKQYLQNSMENPKFINEMDDNQKNDFDNKINTLDPKVKNFMEVLLPLDKSVFNTPEAFNTEFHQSFVTPPETYNTIDNKCKVRNINLNYIVSQLQQYDINDENIKNGLIVLFINASGLNIKHSYPTFLDKFINTMKKNGEEEALKLCQFQYYLDNEFTHDQEKHHYDQDVIQQYFDNTFLSCFGSTIQRKSATDWLMTKNSPIELIGNAIQDFYITGKAILPHEKLKNLNVNKQLSEQIESPVENVEIKFENNTAQISRKPKN